MASRTATSLGVSIQPWSSRQTNEDALKDTLARVSDERGHFRDITEASLQEEIAGEGALQPSDSESEDASEDEDEEDGAHIQSKRGPPTSREELFRAKHEMLFNVAAAEQEVLMSLDFVSLLLSKHHPKQASYTISPVLKEAVPTGTLGLDEWQNMKPDKAREAQEILLATNVRMKGLQNSADSLLAAASRLESNVRNETQYWDQILSISQKGWNVSRIPGQQHRLAVNFGFSESAAEFSRRGRAALSINAQGHTVLDRGVGTRPKALRAVLRSNERVVGSSKLPVLLDSDESTLEARIRYARDSLFDEELYHELIRESRTITSLGVGLVGSAIQFGKLSGSNLDLQVSLDLLCLDEEDHELPLENSAENDTLAEAIVFAARLLLGQAHRDKLRKRSEVPAPLSDKSKEERPVMPILRPIMSFMMHRAALDGLNAYVTRLVQVLDKAQVQSSHILATFRRFESADVTTSEALITSFMQPWTSNATLTILDSKSDERMFDLKIETTLAQGFGPRFDLKVPNRDRTYQVDHIDDFIYATDARIASCLARGLLNVVDGGWTWHENEASIVRDAGINEKEQGMRVSVDSSKQVLSLSSLGKKAVWKVEADSVGKGFWDAKDDVL